MSLLEVKVKGSCHPYGYYGGRKRYPGQLFHIEEEEHFSERWMEKVSGFREAPIDIEHDEGEKEPEEVQTSVEEVQEEPEAQVVTPEQDEKEEIVLPGSIVSVKSEVLRQFLKQERPEINADDMSRNDLVKMVAAVRNEKGSGN